MAHVAKGFHCQIPELIAQYCKIFEIFLIFLFITTSYNTLTSIYMNSL